MNNLNQVKVLQVFGSLDMGGAESRMMDVYRNIDLSEVTFDFVSLSQGKQFFEKEIYSLGGEVFKVGSPREVGLFKHIKQLRICMKKKEYNAVHAHTSYHCGIVMFAAWLERIPVRISHARTTGSKSDSKFKKLGLFFGRLLIRAFSTERFAISEEAGRFLFGKTAFEVIHNSIDLEKYQNITNQEVKTLKNELSITESSLVIGQIGRFDPMKNHTFSIDWFEQFLKRSNNSVLVLVGDGALRGKIESIVKEKGLYNSVIFTGIRDDVPKLIHIFDVLLFPSTFEGLGGVAIEAQAAGIPVVESDTIPKEVDLGLGLVKQCSLTSGFYVWNNAVEESIQTIVPSKEEIKKKFIEKGYVLKSTIEMFMKTYSRSE